MIDDIKLCILVIVKVGIRLFVVATDLHRAIDMKVN